MDFLGIWAFVEGVIWLFCEVVKGFAYILYGICWMIAKFLGIFIK